jgi:DNA-binding response OmpR family regulator
MSTTDKKIFIADDDTDILSILQLMLQSKGYIVHATTNATDIFNYTENDLPDLILLDIWMIGGMDGTEVCALLKENEVLKNIPVVFISANSSIKEMAEKYNVRDYIAKPFDMKYLFDKVAAILFDTEVSGQPALDKSKAS